MYEKWLSDWLDGAARRERLLRRRTPGPSAPLAAARAIAFQIERGEIRFRTRKEFRAHCEQVLKIHLALIELAQICKEGSESNFPSREPWASSEAWQNTYVALAARISDGRVDIERPLKPLANITAFRFFLSDQRRQGRLSSLTEAQLHRARIGDEAQPEDGAEILRRSAALREAVGRLRKEGKLSDADVEMLRLRYAEEWTSPEVAARLRLTPDNVRQLSARRLAQLRRVLDDQELKEAAA